MYGFLYVFEAMSETKKEIPMTYDGDRWDYDAIAEFLKEAIITFRAASFRRYEAAVIYVDPEIWYALYRKKYAIDPGYAMIITKEQIDENQMLFMGVDIKLDESLPPGNMRIYYEQTR